MRSHRLQFVLVIQVGLCCQVVLEVLLVLGFLLFHLIPVDPT